MKGLIFYLQRFTMTGTPADDTLTNAVEGEEVLAYGGNDSITNMADNASIYAGDGADTVQNYYWDGGDAVYIDGGAGADSISNSENYEVTILGGNDNDTIQNFFGSFISINGGKGNDDIYNQFAINSTVNGDAGNDNIEVYRNRNTSINGGAGNDVISLKSNSGTLTVKGGAGNDEIYGDTLKSVGIVYQYSRGEGKDTIYGFKADKDTLKVTSGSYSTQKSGGDLIYSIGNGKVYLKDYFISQVLTNSIDNTIFSGTTDDDLMYNYGTNLTINSGEGNDNIYNDADTVTIDAGAGDDTIDGIAWYSSLNGGAGNDLISMTGCLYQTTIIGGEGDDIIYGDGDNGYNVYQYAAGDGYDIVYNASAYDILKITVEGYDTIKSGNDLIVKIKPENSKNYTGEIKFKNLSSIDIDVGILDNYTVNTIFGGTANADMMFNTGTNVTINSGAGNDSIDNSNTNVIINSGTGNDSIYNGADTVTVEAGTGDDTIEGNMWYSSLNGGAGNDLISIGGGNVFNTTIVGGLGNDTIYGPKYNGSNVYQYAVGDGYDTVINADYNDTLQITEGDYITQKSGNDLIVKIKPEGSKNYTGEIRFKNLSSINIEVPPPETLTNYNDNTIFGGTTDDDLMYNYGTNVTINSGKGDDSIYNDNNYVTINSDAGNDSIYNNSTYVTINSSAGNDSIYTTVDYITIDAGAGNDTIAGNTQYLWLSSINGGAGNDIISISSGNVQNTTIIGGKGNDLIYGNSSVSNELGTIYQYAKGDGNDTIIGHSIYDTISITGSAYMTTISGSDLIVNITSGVNSTVSTGKIIINDGANQDINIAGKPVTVGGGTPSEVSQQDVIKKFMGSLDTTTYSGISAVNQAVKVATGGYFSSAQAVINAMVKDRNRSTGGDNFLKTYCGINIENRSTEDTGSITGKDAGGTTVKTKESIVPESGSLTNFTGNSFTVNGLKVYLADVDVTTGEVEKILSYKDLTSQQQKFWKGLKSWWIGGALDLISESYGSNFGFTSAASANTHTCYISFYNEDDGYRAWTWAGEGSPIRYIINMDYYNDVNLNNKSGLSPKDSLYFDRLTAHEFTHAVMGANIDYYDYLPTYIVEGMAELTHGIDDDRNKDIKALVINTTRMQNALTNATSTDNVSVPGVHSPSYVGGYTFLRYLAKQGSLHYGETSSRDRSADVAEDTTVSIKGAVLTVNDNFNRDTIDLTKYDSTVTKVNASKITQDLTIIGNEWANSVKGGAGNDSIYGNSGNDTLLGGAGNDEIYGDAGNNLLKGEAGNDTLFGAGNDTFTGGTGSDLFVYNAEVSGNAVITDYSSSDSIKISGGKISDTIYSGKDVIFELGESSLTVKNGKNKNIDITVSNGSSASWFIDDDNNFISNDTDIDSITQENYSVTNIETSNFDTFAQDKNILTFTDKK